MKLVDTNYLLRYILRDDEDMYQKACKIIEKGASTRLESIPELIYVLTGYYGVKRKEAALAVTELLKDIEIPEKAIILETLNIYRESKLDYVDCVYISVSKRNNERVLTFDKKLNAKMNRMNIPN